MIQPLRTPPKIIQDEGAVVCIEDCHMEVIPCVTIDDDTVSCSSISSVEILDAEEEEDIFPPGEDPTDSNPTEPDSAALAQPVMLEQCESESKALSNTHSVMLEQCDLWMYNRIGAKESRKEILIMTGVEEPAREPVGVKAKVIKILSEKLERTVEEIASVVARAHRVGITSPNLNFQGKL